MTYNRLFTIGPSRAVRCVGVLISARRCRRWSAVMLAALLLLGSGCSENHNGQGSANRMSVSAGQYSKGYKDGVRDAKWSLTDMHGGWMWLWMMEQEYRDGYEQGWRDGRSAVDLKKRQEEQRGEQ
ncbi:MAG: hypothetical protein JXQ75_19325 [Phycisphaerae bacterium]|nr:hypothetical protein [Phycisphaerae bacterium]